MERRPVHSDYVRSVGYDPSSQILEIEYQNGFVCDYYGVPKPVYSGLLKAPSHLTYHHEHIRDLYPFERIA